MFVFGLVANTIKKKRKKTVLVKYGDFNIVEDNFNMVKKKTLRKKLRVSWIGAVGRLWWCTVNTWNARSKQGTLIDWTKIEKWEKSKVFDCAMCYMIWFPSLRQVWSATGAIGASKTGIARLKSQIGFYMSILWKKDRYLINLLRNDTRLQ